MYDPTVPKTIILASASPRRRQLLVQAGIDFSVIPAHIDEDAIAAADPETCVKILADAKARPIAKAYRHHWVIGADSIVAIDDAILNKPASVSGAEQMLTALSGRTHRVLTGYSIQCVAENHVHTEVCVTDVTFKILRAAEIAWYIDTPEPYDKAGGYAIQGTGAFMVQQINGSYTNVVGLPLCEVIDHLTAAQVIDRRNIHHSTQQIDCQTAGGKSHERNPG